MRNVSILMLIFSGALFLYALLLYRTKNANLIARSYAVKMKDREAYTKQFAKVLALTAAAPMISGIVGLITDNGQLFTRFLIGGIILALLIGVDMMKKVM